MSPQATRFTGIENQGCNVNLESESLSNTEGDSGGIAYCLVHGKISGTGMGGWIHDIVSIYCNSYYIHLCPKGHLYPPDFQSLGSSPIFFKSILPDPRQSCQCFFMVAAVATQHTRRAVMSALGIHLWWATGDPCHLIRLVKYTPL